MFKVTFIQKQRQFNRAHKLSYITGSCRTLVSVWERLWFGLKANKHVVSEVTVKFFSTEPNYSLSLTLTKSCVSKHNHKKTFMIL